MSIRYLRCLLGPVCLLASVAGAPVGAHAQFGIPQVVYDPSNLVQNARQVVQTAQQINQQRQQLAYQLQALRKLRNPNWREVASLVDELDATLRQGEALAYSAASLDEQFRRTFPGYEVPAGWIASEAQRAQATRALATVRATLNTTRRQMEALRPGLQRLAGIKQRMGSIQGTQEALELQTTLQGYVAEELVLLRQAVAIQTNAQAVADAQRFQREMQEQVVLERLLRNTLNRPRTVSPGFDGRWRRP